MPRAQLGFKTFWEEHGITLAIIVILGIVAVPAYNDYVKRNHINQAYASAAAAKAAVEKAFAKGPADMSQRAVTGWTPAAVEHLEAASIGKDGKITLRFAAAVAGAGENEMQIVPVSGGKPLDLSAASSVGRKFEWQCGGSAGKSTLPEKLRPKECRAGSASQ